MDRRTATAAAMAACVFLYARQAMTQNLTQDSKGEGLISASAPPWMLQLNSDKKSAHLTFAKHVSGKRPWFTLSLDGALVNDVASIVRGAQVSPEGRVRATVGQSVLTAPSTQSSPVDAVVLMGGVAAKSFYHAQPESAFGSQVRKLTPSGAEAQVRYYLKLPWDLQVSVAQGIERSDNADDLDDVEATLATKRISPSGDSTWTYQHKVAAKAGSYRRQTQYPFLLDVYWQADPTTKVAITAYARHVMSDGRPETRLGVGLYLLHREKYYSAPAGGGIFEIRNVFDVVGEGLKRRQVRVFLLLSPSVLLGEVEPAK